MKRSVIRQCVWIVALALAPALATAVFHPKRPVWHAEALKPNEVSLADVLRWKEPTLWVDARSVKTYEAGHIPGAMLLNEDHWDHLLDGVLEAWHPSQSVVVYCDSRECQSSERVAARLREAGVEPVFVLKGGWEAWLKAKDGFSDK